MLSIQFLGAFCVPGVVDAKADGAQTQSPPSKALPSGGRRTGQSAVRPLKQEGVSDDRGEGQKILPEGSDKPLWAGSPAASVNSKHL